MPEFLPDPETVGAAVLNAEIERLTILSDRLDGLIDAGAASAADVERAVQVNEQLLDLLSA